MFSTYSGRKSVIRYMICKNVLFYGLIGLISGLLTDCQTVSYYHGLEVSCEIRKHEANIVSQGCCLSSGSLLFPPKF